MIYIELNKKIKQFNVDNEWRVKVVIDLRIRKIYKSKNQKK